PVPGHRRCLTPPPLPPANPGEAWRPDAPAVPDKPDAGLSARTRDRHRRVHDLLAAGYTIRQICHQLDLARGTVRRFARTADVADLLRGQRHSSTVSVLAPFVEHLQQRWAEGITNAATLLAEIRAL